ncbi:axoneme-associated protein mst101(2)-like isoform X2 [Papaver somniferum]|uniref:axoneme-associated protein mst101(2)-like isoform X2 n=1 Tax=Papaver somniferum TaxID=3469 RepID=UPI000E6F5AA2|nr:axoneme-associated protein mst101(2)-like isoform X2 [Papaver somniferum]
MDVRKSPRLPKNPSAAASSSSTGRVEEREVQEEEESSNHSQQINKLISTYFTPPKLKPNISIPKRPVSKFKPNSSSTTTNVEKSQVVEAEKPKKKKKNDAGAVNEKNPRRVWTDADEILLLKDMADYVKRGENPNSAAFYESIQTKISVDVNFEQIRNKIKKARQRYEAKEDEEKKGIVLRFTTPHLQECHELSKPIWGSGGEPEDGGGGVEGSETVGVENEDDLEIRKSKRDEKRKAAESKKPGKENGERKDGAAEEPEEEDVQIHAVAEKEKEVGAENVQVHADAEKEKEVEAENVHVNAVAENQKEVEGGQTKEKNKKKNRKTEENVQVHADAEKQKEVAEAGETKEKNKKKKKKKRKAEKNGQVHADAEKQKEVVEAGEIKEKNKKKKRKAEENVQVHADAEKQKEVEAENVHVHADAEKQKEVEGGETKERNKKKKKKRKAGAGDADCVSENLIEQLAKAALGLESSLNEETKKAIQSIEPSKVAALEEKWKEFQVQEAQMLMQRDVLVHELASMISEASMETIY